MKLKNMIITLILTVFVVFNTVFLYLGIAYANNYSVRISCIIPAIAGKKMPILQETRTTNTKVQVNSPVIFQKDTQEMRIYAEGRIRRRQSACRYILRYTAALLLFH